MLDKSTAATTLDTMQKQLRDAWTETARRAGVAKSDCEKISGAFVYQGIFYDYPGRFVEEVSA